MYMIANLHL